MHPDLLGEIGSAQWTLCLYLKPLNAALMVKIMLFITREDNDLIVGLEIDQAYRAVWHLSIFVWVVFVAHVL